MTPTAALQTGETILLTGGTGWVGSHIAHEALSAGLKVRLAIRSEAKAKELVDALEKLHGKGKIETVTVKDFGADGAYDEAIKGVQGVVHAASDLSFSDNREQVVSGTIAGYTKLLEAAKSEDTVRRVIITSSIVAVGGSNNHPGSKAQHLDAGMYNDRAVEESKTSPNPFNVYATSKALSDRFAFDFVEKNNVQFALTSVNPSLVIGAAVPGYHLASTGAWPMDLAKGARISPLFVFGPVIHVDVDDVAKLHVIALTREGVENERILAVGDHCTVNSLLDAIKSVKPHSAVIDERKDEWNVKDNTTVDVNRAQELLKDQGGLHDLEYSLRGNLQGL